MQNQFQDSHRLYPSEQKLINWGQRLFGIKGKSGILLEGDKLIHEALESGHTPVACWYSDSFESRESSKSLLLALRENAVQMRRISEHLVKKYSTLDTSQGIFAVVDQPDIRKHSAKEPWSLIVAISMVQDPGNLGTVIRTADYFGVDEIWLGKHSADPYKPKVVRGAMGALFRIPVMKLDDLPSKIAEFQRAGAKVWATVPRFDDKYQPIQPEGQRILLIGGESKGLTAELINSADYTYTIPGSGRGESLNLGVAAGIAIYHATVGRRIS